MSIDERTKLKTSRHVYAREFDGDLVLLDLGKGQYYGLDTIGARLWAGIGSGRTVADVAAELAPEYEVDAEVVRADLLELLRDLVEKGLVEPV